MGSVLKTFESHSLGASLVEVGSRGHGWEAVPGTVRKGVGSMGFARKLAAQQSLLPGSDSVRCLIAW